jgi:hypothetical protein
LQTGVGHLQGNPEGFFRHSPHPGMPTEKQGFARRPAGGRRPDGQRGILNLRFEIPTVHRLRHAVVIQNSRAQMIQWNEVDATDGEAGEDAAVLMAGFLAVGFQQAAKSGRCVKRIQPAQSPPGPPGLLKILKTAKTDRQPFASPEAKGCTVSKDGLHCRPN